MATITLKDVCYSYDMTNKAVDHASFCVEKGTYTSLVGENGSGKSTVAKLIAGLLDKESGEITIEGLALNEENLDTIRSKIGIVFQNPDNQFIGSSVQDDIAFGLENSCVPSEKMDAIIQEYASKVKMTEYLGSEPTHLSGGQKQRVAIAGILAMHPEILIFDEATSMLDPQGKDEIKKVIMDLHRESHLTILSITHDIEEVTSSDAVIAMQKGKVAFSGTPEDFFRDEKRLQDLHLDIPFSLKLADALEKEGVQVKRECTMEGMVEELCRLHSKM